jgi:hypothetical protein
MRRAKEAVLRAIESMIVCNERGCTLKYEGRIEVWCNDRGFCIRSFGVCITPPHKRGEEGAP